MIRNPLKKEKPLSINTDKLRLHLYATTKEHHSAEEIDFFKKNNLTCFELSEEKLQDTEYTAEKLIHSLVTSNSHFYHFRCHADTRSENDSEYFLKFNGKNDNIKIMLADLLRSHYKSESKQNSDFCHSLTFLNACGSAVASPKNLLTFPKVFLEHLGQEGFIGTEFSVLQGFAYQFARRFYANLLNDGNDGNLEKALFKTRWFFANKYLHLMGLFYTLYAAPDSEIVLSSPMSIQVYDEDE